MQKKIAAFLFSTRLMGVLFISYFVAMIIGTFLDVGQETSPTPYSRYWIYDAWWFTAIHVLFVVNFLGNIVRFRLLRKEKITTLIFHSSFIFILIGAGITRYISYEGVMPITEGTSENTFLSEKTYLEVLIDGEQDGKAIRRQIKKELSLSPRLNNNFTWTEDFIHSTQNRSDKTDFTFSFNKFIDGAEDGFVEDQAGKWHLKVVEAGDGTRHEHFLVEGETVSIHNVLYSFNNPQEGSINIHYDGEQYTIKTPFGGTNMVMATQQQSVVEENVETPLNLRALYNLSESIQFVIPDEAVKGRTGIVEKEVKEKNQEDALFVTIAVNGDTKTIGLLGGKGYSNDKKEIEVGGHKMYLSYGSESLELPFAIKLNDFIAERYPGTENSYSSFKSMITVEDPEEKFDYDIFMNHVLDHKGFRFFQASFFPDETGTILSVSHDFWGTWITYIGYFLMYLGMMLILFDKGSRFGDLKRRLDAIKDKKSKLTVLLFLFAFAKAGTVFSQEVSNGNVINQDTISVTTDALPELDVLSNNDNHQQGPPTQEDLQKLIVANAVDAEHAARFGRMVIQEDGGRMMPINTYSSLLLRKLSRSNTYAGLTADQIMLSMLENPVLWYNVEILYLQKGNDSLRNVLGVTSDTKRFKAMDFFTPKIKYKLEPYLPEAYSEANPTKIAKEFRDVDQRLGLLNRTLGGEVLKIFPKPESGNNKWLSYPELNESGYKGMDSLYSKQIIPLYLNSLQEARQTGNYDRADTFLNSISSFQKRFGADIMPSEKKIDAEIFYNKYDVFTKLYWLYMLAAFFMMVFVITAIFNDSKFVKLMTNIGLGFVIILFLIHLGGLIWRWYISGHAPWSNAYESVLYVGWATMFFGLAISIIDWTVTRKVYDLYKINKLLFPLAIIGAGITSLIDLLFAKKSSHLTVASGAFVTGFILWAASMNWMNPEIENLQAVLNSYWLMIHTAVIVASYGPFTLGAILGLVSLFLMIFTTKKNKEKMDLNIKEITIINEMALTVGMVLLAIGTFLGGQWANESWGRYWGWDPKETWALISLIVYAFVIHMRLIPGLRGKWLFNFLSILSLGSILFTYFGVNYYLSGLHAYQSGGDIATQKIVMYLGVLTVLGVLSYVKYKKYYVKSKKS